MSAWRRKTKVSTRLDRAMGYGLFLIVCIVLLMVLPLQFIAALIILAVVWGFRSHSHDEFRRRMAKMIEAKRQSGKTHMKRGKRKGKLKHHKPNLMPLGLRKAVRTGDPIPIVKDKMPVFHEK